MTNRLRCFLAATVLCLALPAAGLAEPQDGQPPDTVAATASGAVDQAAAVAHPVGAVAAQAVQAPVVYLVQPQAAAVAPAPVAAQASGALGVLAAVPLDTWALLLGVFAMVVLQLLGAQGTAVRSKVDFWIDAAYYAAEAAARSAAPGSTLAKLPLALNAFHQGLLGEGIKPTSTDVARAQAAWTAKAESEHVATDIRAKAAAQAAAESKPESASALLDEAAKA